ncbi:MAG: hypothetical protein EP338_06975 [Bacteroidetes bacterium]|nr:MAG: hypothetical protein EP338_06975 [Bacteroidota bacterium]
MKRALALLLFLAVTSTGHTQEKRASQWHLQAMFSQGVVLPEYSFVHSTTQTPIQQMELSFLKQSKGNSFWQEIYNYPKFGLALFAGSHGNPAILGHEIAVYPFVSLSSIRRKKYSWDQTIGLGLGWASKKFDLDNNPMNIAVGSHLNVHFRFRSSFCWYLNQRWNLITGINFHHFSNANMKEPNLGINTVSIAFGANYRISPDQEYLHNEIPVHEAANEFAFVYAAGGKHTRALQTDVYFTSSLSFEFKRRWKRKFWWGLGTDLFYDSATEVELSTPGKKSYRPSDDFRSGLHLSQEFVYQQFSFVLQEGIYLGLIDQVNHNVMYNRAIIRYKWNPHFFSHISMKSHLHILDYPEVGFAYYFSK